MIYGDIKKALGASAGEFKKGHVIIAMADSEKVWRLLRFPNRLLP